MNTQTHFEEKKKNRFHFGYLGHDLNLEREANLKLIQLLAFAPPGATGIGFVEKSEPGFISTVTIQSTFRTFTAKAAGTMPESTVKKALERLENELFRWRFGGGSGNYSGKQTRVPTGSPIPWARSGRYEILPF